MSIHLKVSVRRRRYFWSQTDWYFWACFSRLFHLPTSQRVAEGAVKRVSDEGAKWQGCFGSGHSALEEQCVHVCKCARAGGCLLCARRNWEKCGREEGKREGDRCQQCDDEERDERPGCQRARRRVVFQPLTPSRLKGGQIHKADFFSSHKTKKASKNSSQSFFCAWTERLGQSGSSFELLYDFAELRKSVI